MLKIDYDKEGDILEIKFSDNSIKDSEYIEESGLGIDYDNNLKSGTELFLKGGEIL